MFYFVAMNIEKLYAIYRDYPQITTDTRKSVAGKIFFCLKGPNFDANTFAEEALRQGAMHVVSDDQRWKGTPRITVVNDALQTLQNLALRHRETFSFPVIGLTGSNGKTTHKELIKAVLSKKFKTYATEGNLNNHIGVPLTLLSIPSDAGIAIIEMGANHRGEIRDLCRIAGPNYGLITNIGKAHLEGFGGIEGVKLGKKELYDFISTGKGKLFVNGDDPVLDKLSKKIPRVLYGSDPAFFVSGKILNSEPRVRFEFYYRGASSGEVQANMVGRYNFQNYLAAACVGVYFGVEPGLVRKALASYTPKNNRSQILDTEHNRLILDAYNANPTSMELALQDFAAMDEWPKIAFVGHMLELGDTSQAEHQHLINQAIKLGVPTVLVGDQFASCDKQGLPYFSTREEFLDWLKKKKWRGHLILLKGSRGIAMEKAMEFL